MTVSINVSGNVQGVFFRRSAKEEADNLDLVGWVRNEADGSVQIIVVGDKNKLDQFVKWSKNGSPLSKVDRLVVDWRDEDENFDRFDIL